MRTLLQSALTGWTDYTQHGKFAAFLLLAIVYLGFVLRGPSDADAWGKMDETIEQPGGTADSRARRRLFQLYLYGVLITLGCICPVTALILLKYQTAFYSYVWIWAAVPQTALIAWATADFLNKLWQDRSARTVIATVILFGILFLGGNPVSEWTQAQTAQIPALSGMPQQRQEKVSAWETLEQLSAYHAEAGNNEEFCLWAPKEIMAASRAYSAGIHPVYGRSIWDASLGSYSYDTYEIWQEDLYLWMNHLEATGETEYLRTDESAGEETTAAATAGRTIDFAACLDSAGQAGIDYILLPGNLSEETQEALQKTAGQELQPFGGYFLIVLPGQA